MHDQWDDQRREEIIRERIEHEREKERKRWEEEAERKQHFEKKNYLDEALFKCYYFDCSIHI